ncbi:MAG: hypothetical protein J6X78_02830 [Treponema sp.]|nr:hypothetical protein [Treponema sp.]
MKAIVIYKSQTGFTKKYAEWISEAAGCDCVELKKARKSKLAEYDAIVFGGWCMAGGISKVAWFKKLIPSLSAAGKKLIVFMVGASPAESDEAVNSLRRNFTDDEWSKVKAFYCPGGLDWNKMSGGSKMAIKMLLKILSCKKDATEEDMRTVEMLSKSFDISDKKYIEPILAELK